MTSSQLCFFFCPSPSDVFSGRPDPFEWYIMQYVHEHTCLWMLFVYPTVGADWSERNSHKAKSFIYYLRRLAHVPRKRWRLSAAASPSVWCTPVARWYSLCLVHLANLFMRIVFFLCCCLNGALVCVIACGKNNKTTAAGAFANKLTPPCSPNRAHSFFCSASGIIAGHLHIRSTGKSAGGARTKTRAYK